MRALWEESVLVVEDVERQLVDNAPEAYVRKEIRLRKEKLRKEERFDHEISVGHRGAEFQFSRFLQFGCKKLARAYGNL